MNPAEVAAPPLVISASHPGSNAALTSRLQSSIVESWTRYAIRKQLIAS